MALDVRDSEMIFNFKLKNNQSYNFLCLHRTSLQYGALSLG